jgi:hypothetical protein
MNPCPVFGGVLTADLRTISEQQALVVLDAMADQGAGDPIAQDGLGDINTRGIKRFEAKLGGLIALKARQSLALTQFDV